jgi:hypothetical protein
MAQNSPYSPSAGYNQQKPTIKRHPLKVTTIAGGAKKITGAAYSKEQQQ